MTDSDAAMLANCNFERILSSIRNSGLNYTAHVSPFSATISLRKTIIKDKTGAYITPAWQFNSCANSDLQSEISSLEDKLKNLRLKYEESLSDKANEIENNNLLRKMIKQRDNIIDDLIVENIKAEKAANQDIIRRTRFSEENTFHVKEHHMEVEARKQEMQYFMTKHQELEEKFYDLLEKYESPKVNFSSAEPTSSIKCLEDPIISSRDNSPNTSEASSLCTIGYDCYVAPYKEESLNPTYVSCKSHPEIMTEEEVFSNSGLNRMQPSLVSHWSAVIQFPNSTVLSLPSFRAHYVSQGKATLSNDEDFQESLWQKLEEQYQEERRNGCKQS